jgi:hypothetical protein
MQIVIPGINNNECCAKSYDRPLNLLLRKVEQNGGEKVY